ncbi:uncharacterized protein At3g43530-like [Raphanus sativus]|uniref:Uncharacterized protein At3g43530-like n=1 Tax=Raphanus sativus TaxID=3726 RepID=A0A9W3CGG1_RAPSA|nr:uncharacterized protein At3g43530-like [Raphanus sativus]
MAGRGRGGKQKTKQRKSTKRKNAPVEEQHVEELSTRNGSDDQSAHGNESDHLSAHAHETDHESASSQECQPLPPDELYFKNTEYTKTCKIQSKCYVSNTVGIIKKLEPENDSPELKWFENHPQFRHFFHMPDEQNLRLLGMWTLLLRTIPVPEGEDTAWFAVNGVPIRYSLREHALISGLDCRDYPDEYEKLGSFAFVDRHFDSHKEITMESVKEKMLSMSPCGDRLRMAVLYFLGTVIRAKGRWNAAFDSFILRVVNNVEICKTFPWGRLTFDDTIGSLNYVMKKLKGKPKNNVNFPGFIVPLEVLAFECIPALNAEFRERVAGCMSNCPRMCKSRFQNNSMKGYPLSDLYDVIGETKVITSVLVPTVDEQTLLASIMEWEPDYENEEGLSNLWSTWLTVKEKPIFWQELYELDVAAREFPKKKDKRKVNEEASSSSHGLDGLEDVLKGVEERLMSVLMEVCVKVETMDQRLGVVEKSHVVLKRRSLRMKAMEKRLAVMEKDQYHLKKRARKQKEMEERLDGVEKEMKRKENENNDGFYQTMDYDWNGGSYDRNGKESQEKAKKKEKEIEEEVETEGQVEETESEEKTSTPPLGRTKANAARRLVLVSPDQWIANLCWDAEQMVAEEADKRVEEEVAAVVEEEAEKVVAEEAENVVEEEAEKVVAEEAENVVEEEPKIYTDEEKQGWILTICKTSDGIPAVDKTDGTEGAPTPTGVKHRPKAMAVRKHAPNLRGRPRKDAQPKKFTTPQPTKRTRARSQWVSSPYTEGNTDEIEGRKKKPRTEA